MGTNISANHSEGLPGYVMVLSWFPESAIGGVNQAVLNLIHTMQLEGRYRPRLLVSNGHALPERAPHIECEVIPLRLRNTSPTRTTTTNSRNASYSQKRGTARPDTFRLF